MVHCAQLKPFHNLYFPIVPTELSFLRTFRELTSPCPLGTLYQILSQPLRHEAQGGRRCFGIMIPTLKPPFGDIYCIAVSDFTLQFVLKVKPRPSARLANGVRVRLLWWLEKDLVRSFSLNSRHAAIQAIFKNHLIK